MPHRTPGHVLEAQSRDRLTALFHDKGWTVERIASDYGEDLLVRIFHAGTATPFIFFVQSKAFTTTTRLLVRRGKYLSVPLDREHISSWRSFREPVVLAIWDVRRDVIYWQTVQAAAAVADRRADWAGRAAPESRIWVPTANILDNAGADRLAARAQAAWARILREREGAKVLTDALRDQLGLDIDYDPQYGIIIIPGGTFVPEPAKGHHVCTFGRAARDIGKIASILGVPHEEAFERSLYFLVSALEQVASGETAIFRAPNGQIVDVWKSVAEVNEEIFKIDEQSDED